MKVGDIISIKYLELPSGSYPEDVGSHGIVLSIFNISIPHLEVFNKRENCYTVITNTNKYVHLKEDTSFVSLKAIA